MPAQQEPTKSKLGQKRKSRLDFEEGRRCERLSDVSGYKPSRLPVRRSGDAAGGGDCAAVNSANQYCCLSYLRDSGGGREARQTLPRQCCSWQLPVDAELAADDFAAASDVSSNAGVRDTAAATDVT